jgi:hypothetical protein
METLLNTFGHSGIVGVVLLVAVPLSTLGWVLRRAGRRGLERLQRLESARTRIGDVRPGAVTLVGKWRAVAPGRGLLEDERGRAVLVQHDGEAPENAESFLVAGTAVGEVDDPRAIDFRTSARLYSVDARESCGFVGDEKKILGAAHRAARRGAGLGAALFAAGVALAMASVVLAVRAYYDDVSTY